MSENQQNTGAAVAIGFVAGIVVGGVLGILFAPRSGKETRALLAEKAGEVKEKVVDLAYDIEDKASVVVDKFKETAAELKKRPA
jgi:gas vesicle protein